MNNFVELQDLPCHDLYKELTRLLESKQIEYYNNKGEIDRAQICINTIPGQEKNIHFGRGSLIYDWDARYYDKNGVLITPERDIPLKEEDFSVLCTQFIGTLFEDVYNSLKEKYHIGRVRIMNTKPKTCLTWHHDNTKRIHYPITTQSGCFMVIEDEIKHLEQNKWYLTDTLKYHTAFNGSNERRIHLVASILT